MDTSQLHFTPRCCAATTFSAIAGITLFVIGCIALSGGIPNPTVVGGVTIGLSGGEVLFILLSGDLKERKLSVIATLFCMIIPFIMGILGVAGVVNSYQIGWGIVGTPLAFTGLGVLFGCGAGCIVGGYVAKTGKIPQFA